MSNPAISTLISKRHVIWWVRPILQYSRPLPSDRSTYFLWLSRHSFLPIFFVLAFEDLVTLGRPCGQASQMDPWHRDRTDVPEEVPAPLFQFGSDNGDTPDPELQIPTTDKSKWEEQFLAQLAQLIPTYINKPSIPLLEQSPSLAAQMSQIVATTTRTSTSLLARTIGAGVSSRDGTGTASHIW